MEDPNSDEAVEAGLDPNKEVFDPEDPKGEVVGVEPKALLAPNIEELDWGCEEEAPPPNIEDPEAELLLDPPNIPPDDEVFVADPKTEED